MAVAFDAVSSVIIGGPTSPTDLTTLTVGSGSNRALICYLFFSSGPTIPPGITCTWDQGGSNQAMTLITNTSVREPNSNDCCLLYGLVNPVSGNKTLRVTWSSGSPGTIMVGAASWTGVDQTGGNTTFPNGNNNQGTNTAATITISSQTNNVVTAFMQGIGGVTSVSDTALVFAGEPEGNWAAGTTSKTLTGTIASGGGWAISGTDILAAAVTGAVDPGTYRSTRPLARSTRNFVGAKGPRRSPRAEIGGATANAALTQADATLSAAAALAISATASPTQANATLSAASTLAVSATASLTQANDALSAAATAAIAANAALSQANDALSAASTIAVATSASLTQANDALTAASTLAIAATATLAEAQTLVADASGGGITANATLTQADAALSAAATLAIGATATLTQANDTLAAATTVAVAATATLTQANDTLAAAATVAIAATATLTQANDTLSAAATLAIGATATLTQANDTLSAAATVAIAATATLTQANDTLASSSTLAIAANASIAEAPQTLSATVATTGIQANAILVQADTTLLAAVTAAISASAILVQADDTVPGVEPPLVADAGRGGGGRRREFVYDRPYLAEYAKALRRAIRKGTISAAAEIAHELVEVAFEEPQTPTVLNVIETASKLQQLQQLENRTRLNLARLLIVSAEIADREKTIREEEDDTDLLLLM